MSVSTYGKELKAARLNDEKPFSKGDELPASSCKSMNAWRLSVPPLHSFGCTSHTRAVLLSIEHQHREQYRSKDEIPLPEEDPTPSFFASTSPRHVCTCMAAQFLLVPAMPRSTRHKESGLKNFDLMHEELEVRESQWRCQMGEIYERLRAKASTVQKQIFRDPGCSASYEQRHKSNSNAKFNKGDAKGGKQYSSRNSYPYPQGSGTTQAPNFISGTSGR
ncbi:hypothetical protein BJ508DRAFT_307344 [Ascobolus immersus RN42]|uniref:Uncharacterized protein n=1 Tax=Ascobolus immersus RN42 TaxID=1160509 RepID=A0A3N4I3F7_ASCIM|nr:hypothetical protein BJ508DRAFT_307344 [Ascobolus immersus RN42]